MSYGSSKMARLTWTRPKRDRVKQKVTGSTGSSLGSVAAEKRNTIWSLPPLGSIYFLNVMSFLSIIISVRVSTSIARGCTAITPANNFGTVLSVTTIVFFLTLENPSPQGGGSKYQPMSLGVKKT